MKKYIMIIVFLVLLTACGSKDTKQQEGYVFKLNGQEITMGDKAAEFIKGAGSPTSQSSAPSCAFEGDDTVYDYSSYQVTTYQSNGVELVTGVYLLDSSISTKEGVNIGSTMDEVKKAYGDDYQEEYGVFTYTKGKTNLAFVVVDQVVTSISYTHIVE